jgi:cysteine-rich repeat protein
MTTSLRLAMAAVLALAGSRVAVAQPVCGNGVVEPPEVCDDTNVVDGDGCDSNCTVTACGNGVVTVGEECDDGNLVDGDCCSALCVNENQPPDCSAAYGSIEEMWPPNHKMVSMTVEGVTDPGGDTLVVAVTGIMQDEPIDGPGDGSTCPDATGIGTDGASLRSERAGPGDGRTYHVAFEAVDRCNVACTGEVLVCVRHDRGRNGACGDGGPLYDSTAAIPPCEGEGCGPESCVPDPEDVDSCDGEALPGAVEQKMDRARKLLARAGGGKGKRLGRAAAKQLAKAGKRAARAATDGSLSDECAAALATALEGAEACAACTTPTE